MTSFYAAFNGGTASTSEQNNFATVSTRNRSASGQLIDNNNSNWDLPYQKAYPTTYQSDVWKLPAVKQTGGSRDLQRQAARDESRDLQARLRVLSGEALKTAVRELLPTVQGRLNILQSLFTVSSQVPDLLLEIIDTIDPAFLQIAQDAQGATALQTLIGDASDITVRKRVEQCFSCERVLALSQCGHGSHVVRKLLSAWTADETTFLFPLMRANLATIACSKYGTVVLQRLIDALVAEDVIEALLIEMIGHASLLAQDPYGNYLLQYVMSSQQLFGSVYNRDVFIQACINALQEENQGRLATLCCHKFSSNVIEHALCTAGERVRELFYEICDYNFLDTIIRDRYGNYIVQRVLELGAARNTPQFQQFQQQAGQFGSQTQMGTSQIGTYGAPGGGGVVGPSTSAAPAAGGPGVPAGSPSSGGQQIGGLGWASSCSTGCTTSAQPQLPSSTSATPGHTTGHSCYQHQTPGAQPQPQHHPNGSYNHQANTASTTPTSTTAWGNHQIPSQLPSVADHQNQQGFCSNQTSTCFSNNSNTTSYGGSNSWGETTNQSSSCVGGQTMMPQHHHVSQQNGGTPMSTVGGVAAMQQGHGAGINGHGMQLGGGGSHAYQASGMNSNTGSSNTSSHSKQSGSNGSGAPERVGASTWKRKSERKRRSVAERGGHLGQRSLDSGAAKDPAEVLSGKGSVKVGATGRRWPASWRSGAKMPAHADSEAMLFLPS
eukprot:CAMPEP_0178988610 /NCGR_PEP_ID=MMETSP0795-20121207/3900_1 /TAXON_ID=88552 /ORGANISM="Amoebophrya sp., Strain Ameob2" /LENGTH=719 /DNA_ID=CAMNT_0020679891 /DNA_START=3 /DNA_END=2161 /DNA_ORIENTATION=+